VRPIISSKRSERHLLLHPRVARDQRDAKKINIIGLQHHERSKDVGAEWTRNVLVTNYFSPRTGRRGLKTRLREGKVRRAHHSRLGWNL
jgi:hypothetical protein